MSDRRRALVGFSLLGFATFGLFLWTSWGNVAPWVAAALLLALGLRSGRWTPLLAFAGAWVLSLGATLAALFAGPVVRDHLTRRAFDSAAWKAEDRGAARGVRIRMIDDLLRTHQIVGMTRVEVQLLLGIPPATGYFQDYDYVYWLGPERGLISMDSEWLAIRFDGDIVVKADLLKD